MHELKLIHVDSDMIMLTPIAIWVKTGAILQK